MVKTSSKTAKDCSKTAKDCSLWSFSIHPSLGLSSGPRGLKDWTGPDFQALYAKLSCKDVMDLERSNVNHFARSKLEHLRIYY